MSQLVFYCRPDDTVPFTQWFQTLPEKAKIACRAKLERLRLLGHQLRRPEADYLRDGIYELRIKSERVNYRILYFFQGQMVIVVSHGIMKQRAEVPLIEIKRALWHKQVLIDNPKLYISSPFH